MARFCESNVKMTAKTPEEQAPASRLRDGFAFVSWRSCAHRRRHARGAARQFSDWNACAKAFRLSPIPNFPSHRRAGLARQSESIVASAPGLVISRDQFTPHAADRIATRSASSTNCSCVSRRGTTAKRHRARTDQADLLENLKRSTAWWDPDDFDARSESIIRGIIDSFAERRFSRRPSPRDVRESAIEHDGVHSLEWRNANALMLMLATYGVERSALIALPQTGDRRHGARRPACRPHRSGRRRRRHLRRCMMRSATA